jgi:lipopolysaccharide transport system ATP-binding protein
MAIAFRDVSFPPIHQFSVTAPDGVVIGLIGEEGSGAREVLWLASGASAPVSGEVEASGNRRLISAVDPLNLAPVETLALEHALAAHDALVRTRASVALERLRRAGATVLMLSHEQDLLRSLSDEVWWLHEGRIAAKGDPREVLEQYNRHIAGRVRAWGGTMTPMLNPSMQRGDGRARILKIETADDLGGSTTVWQSGANVQVGVTVQFESPVDDPVIGIMIRTRIGFEVYGTNSELEGIKLGPCQAGDTITVRFRFCCDLCPQEYSMTAASHDPDGVWHDWLEDAVAFSVTDSRYTAGVANLKAALEVERTATSSRG